MVRVVWEASPELEGATSRASRHDRLLFRDLCAQKENAIENLCDLFDQRTGDGADMSHYDGLIQKALASIERTFQVRATHALLAGREGVRPTAAETPRADSEDFELVTWVVVLAP